MSATPIPRTLTMTIYGDMDLSIIKEKPKSRKEVITYSKLDTKINDVVKFVKKEIKNEIKFLVCPLIESLKKLTILQQLRNINFYILFFQKK